MTRGTKFLKILFWLLWVVSDLNITQNGILLTTDYTGRASGEAFVQFASAEQTERALEKNKQSMGHRLVGVVQWAHYRNWIRFKTLNSHFGTSLKKFLAYPIFHSNVIAFLVN